MDFVNHNNHASYTENVRLNPSLVRRPNASLRVKADFFQDTWAIPAPQLTPLPLEQNQWVVHAVDFDQSTDHRTTGGALARHASRRHET